MTSSRGLAVQSPSAATVGSGEFAEGEVTGGSVVSDTGATVEDEGIGSSGKSVGVGSGAIIGGGETGAGVGLRGVGAEMDMDIENGTLITDSSDDESSELLFAFLSFDDFSLWLL
jgi:hypothetical protein